MVVAAVSLAPLAFRLGVRASRAWWGPAWVGRARTGRAWRRRLQPGCSATWLLGSTLIGAAEFESAASRSQSGRSTRLSYAPSGPQSKRGGGLSTAPAPQPDRPRASLFVLQRREHVQLRRAAGRGDRR